MLRIGDIGPYRSVLVSAPHAPSNCSFFPAPPRFKLAGQHGIRMDDDAVTSYW